MIKVISLHFRKHAGTKNRHFDMTITRTYLLIQKVLSTKVIRPSPVHGNEKVSYFKTKTYAGANAVDVPPSREGRQKRQRRRRYRSEEQEERPKKLHERTTTARRGRHEFLE